MATFFHGNPEIQTDGGLQTLILMNPGYNNVGYSDATQQQQQQQPPPSASSNFAFLSSTSARAAAAANNNNNNNPFDAPPTTNGHQFVGIPLPLTSSSSSSVEAHPFHGLIPRAQYHHLYGQFEQVVPAREINRSQQQGLSLTLSSQEVGGNRQTVLSPTSGGGSPSSASGISNNGGTVGTGVVQSVLLGSKYLKATQELLEETVTVGKGKLPNGTVIKETRETAGDGGERETSGKSGGGGELTTTTAERQEIQMKKAKLVHMLEEVEQRYSQYHHQMQVVISWFEQIAGIGSARTYTALALETISKQFRSLKDTIICQIKAANKSLGEEETKNIEGSRLKFVDHQLRQQKALQQLGMIQPNAWRPQRGLPERSVSVLRAWLFEHFLHPYPKDSDKHMLAKQTGLTRSQVSNWFINARVRLWKPMVEEMYLEETKEHEKTTGSEEKTNNEGSIPDTGNQDNHSTITIPPPSTTFPTSLLNNRNPSSLFALIGSSDMEVQIHGSPKKQRSSNNNNEMEMNTEEVTTNNSQDQISMKYCNDQRQTRDVGFSLLGGAAPTNFIGGFGTYFNTDQFPGAAGGGGYSTNNSGFSLTLGLPHCESLNQSFIPNNNPNNMQNEFGGALNSPTPTSSSSHRPVVYETVNLQNRKRFAAQLMHDFVA